MTLFSTVQGFFVTAQLGPRGPYDTSIDTVSNSIEQCKKLSIKEALIPWEPEIKLVKTMLAAASLIVDYYNALGYRLTLR